MSMSDYEVIEKAIKKIAKELIVPKPKVNSPKEIFLKENEKLVKLIVKAKGICSTGRTLIGELVGELKGWSEEQTKWAYTQERANSNSSNKHYTALKPGTIIRASNKYYLIYRSPQNGICILTSSLSSVDSYGKSYPEVITSIKAINEFLAQVKATIDIFNKKPPKTFMASLKKVVEED